MMRRPADLALWAAALWLIAAFANQPADAHKPITSKYTYNEHVYPIVRDKCGACHANGGIAPMSLLTYQDARPWAESIRDELTAERMPPWHVDPTGGVPVLAPRIGSALTAKELDTILVWVTGGTPEGNPLKRPAPPAVAHGWLAGMPDAIVAMPEAATVPVERQEETREFLLSTGFTDTRWIKGADLLPGNPAIVHDASIAIEKGAELAAWTPGGGPTMTTDVDSGAAYRLDAGRRLVLRVHYKKSWRDQHVARSDRSTVGLYFTDASKAAHEITQLAINPGAASAPPTLTTSLTLLALRPIATRAHTGVVGIEATLPTGEPIRLLRLRGVDSGWPRRYWLAKPVVLPAGTRIRMLTDTPSTGSARDSDLSLALDGISGP